VKIDKTTLILPPKTSSRLELFYGLMHEAKNQPETEEGKFRAMDCHSDILELGDLDYGVADVLQSLGGYADIAKNQERLGIS
jgi:hypothetical protein